MAILEVADGPPRVTAWAANSGAFAWTTPRQGGGHGPRISALVDLVGLNMPLRPEFADFLLDIFWRAERPQADRA
jgi:hypothetical protein